MQFQLLLIAVFVGLPFFFDPNHTSPCLQMLTFSLGCLSLQWSLLARGLIRLLWTAAIPHAGDKIRIDVHDLTEVG